MSLKGQQDDEVAEKRMSLSNVGRAAAQPERSLCDVDVSVGTAPGLRGPAAVSPVPSLWVTISLLFREQACSRAFSVFPLLFHNATFYAGVGDGGGEMDYLLESLCREQRLGRKQ